MEEKNLHLIRRLKANGLQFEINSTFGTLIENRFQGSTFVVSGSFDSFSRNEIKKMIEDYGGRNMSSISSKTNYILAGEKMGPSKLKKAQDLGIKIISENDFKTMLGI